MRIVVTTATGNIGKVLAARLLDAQAQLVLPVRDKKKVAAFAERGAQVREGSQDDAAFMTEVVRGADALFWLTPPDYHAVDFREHQRELGRVAAAVAKASPGLRMVNLSAVGAHRRQGVGQVDGAGDVEQLIDAAGATVTHLRAAYFIDNFAQQLENIATANRVALPVKADSRLAMVATQDIAEAAAARLLDSAWKGRQVLELLGPEDLTFAEATAQLAQGLERALTFVPIPPQAMLERVLKSGRAGKSFAEQQLQMFQGIDQGLMSPQTPRTREGTTRTAVAEFARTVLKPMLERRKG
jgi:uncharacterized protein YbjT (DUF2867 family)